MCVGNHSRCLRTDLESAMEISNGFNTSPMRLTELMSCIARQDDPLTKDKGVFLLWLLINMVL